MIIETHTISAGETAHFLQIHLGSLRQWRDFLSDCIRYRQDIKGYTLMPCARKKGATGWGPVYSINDVKAFIKSVKAAEPQAGKPIRAVMVKIDSAKSWRLNKFDRKGLPVAMLRAVEVHRVGTNG